MIKFTWLFLKVCAGQFFGVVAAQLVISEGLFIVTAVRTLVMTLVLYLLRNVEISEEHIQGQTEFKWDLKKNG